MAKAAKDISLFPPTSKEGGLSQAVYSNQSVGGKFG